MSKDKGSGVVKWLVVIVVIAGLAGGAYWYRLHESDIGPDYKTAPIIRGDLVQLVTATGQLNPKTNVDVGTQVSGIISKLYVDFNSKVTNQQIIAQLDPATYKAVVDAANADLANSKAGEELAAAESERQTALYNAKIIAKADYDTAVAGLDQAKALVMLKEASLKQAQVNLAYTTVYAPVDGVVISRNVDVGQTVASSLSAPTLFMIANDLTKMQIDALVSEADIGGVETNQQVNFTVDAFPSRTFQGIVIQIRNAAQTNQNVITYDTVIGVDNSDMKLRPGMTANVSIITAQRNNVLKIPNGALRFHLPEANDAKKDGGYATSSAQAGGGNGSGDNSHGGAGGQGGGHKHAEKVTHTVYTVAKSADGKQTAKPVQVKTGVNDGVYTQLLDGLKEDDEVIVGINPPAGASQPTQSPFGGGRRF